uniref:Uncharacterized protein n=1 Tax=Hyaloperonospora arabidopsidis (strain Emoy2) TaxID=559515 RepID=M4B4G1_HYAAE
MFLIDCTKRPMFVDAICVIYLALQDIRRKRWRFLEDACSVVLRHIFELVSSSSHESKLRLKSRTEVLSATEGITFCLYFLEPLVDLTVSSAPVLSDHNEIENENDGQEALNQRAVLVAALLHLFAAVTSDATANDVTARLVANILRCGINVYVIIATLRFREELVECRRALLPSCESDTETESEVGFKDEEEAEANEFEVEDARWVSGQVASVWGLTNFRYFLETSGQAHTFAAWSRHGIGNFVYALLMNDQHKVNTLPVIASPFSWLFYVAAYAHDMIISDKHQNRIRGLELLRVVGKLCPREKLSMIIEKEGESSRKRARSFWDQVACFFNRDWVSPVIQVTTNAMVSFLEIKDRSAALTNIKELISKLAVDDRFWLLRGLLMQCPYGNASAVLLDIVRDDAVRTWSLTDASRSSPFTTVAIYLLLRDILSQAAERDLVFQADLLASCMSLVRFLYIRDKGNKTGIRSKAFDCGIQEVLLRISKRLQVMIDEALPYHVADAESCSAENFPRLVIVEASLCSTLGLFE